MRSAIFALSGTTLLFVFTSAACGGAIASIDDGTAAQQDDGGVLDDAAFSDEVDTGTSVADGEALTACPTIPPQDGASCAIANLSCEYGGDGPHLRCSTLFTCVAVQNEAATWSARLPEPDCVGTQAGNAPTCPSSFGALASGSACPANTGEACVYPEGLCECSMCVPDDGGSAQSLWSCKPWPVAPPPCPSPRPRIGSACTMDKQGCYYGSWCNSVGFGQPAMVCRDGLWHNDELPQGPPCPAPIFCGQ